MIYTPRALINGESCEGAGDDMATKKGEAEESADRVVGRNLRELRLSRELTVEQVAEAIGVTEFVLGGVERGTQKAYPALIVSAARFFGVSAARLFDGPTPPPPPPSGDADAYALAERVLASRPETREVLLDFIEQNADLPGTARGASKASARSGRRRSGTGAKAAPAPLEDERPPGEPPAGQDVDRAIGANLRRLREAAGLSQKQLGELLGSSHARVMRLEAGRTRAPAPLLVELAKLLKGSLSDLLQGLTVEDPEPRSAAAVEDGPTKDLAEQIVSLPDGLRRQIRVLLDREASGR